MMTDLRIFAVASAMARHAASRQALTAQNIANADTPGYRARDLAPFDAAMAESAPARMIETPGEPSPNGNTVSLEAEMLRSASAARDHDIAVTLYSKSLNLLRAALGRAR
jgi:flagellar basal-body rod protein FlgB